MACVPDGHLSNELQLPKSCNNEEEDLMEKGCGSFGYLSFNSNYLIFLFGCGEGG